MTTPDPHTARVSMRQIRAARYAAREHAAAMEKLYSAVNRVAETAAKLTAELLPPDAGFGVDHPLYKTVDDAMGTLQTAYQQIATAFDAHFEANK